MKININEPIDHKWTLKKKVAKIYGITTKEVTQIIKEKCYE